jgi:hypothetical protein
MCDVEQELQAFRERGSKDPPPEVIEAWEQELDAYIEAWQAELEAHLAAGPPDALGFDEAVQAARYGLTERGRVRAVLTALVERWEGLSVEERAEALRLVDELADCYRRRARPRRKGKVPPVGRAAI